MNLTINHYSPAVVLATAVLVIMLGLLIWHGQGRVRLRAWGAVASVPASQRAGQWVVAFGVLIGVFGLVLAAPRGAAGASASPGQPTLPVTVPSGQVTPISSVPPAGPTAQPSSAAGTWVRITNQDGLSWPLSRNVVAVGNIGRVRYACYAVTWRVVASNEWTAYYIKRVLSPTADGAFRTDALQMGSPGETGSVWTPYVVGGTPAACSWLRHWLALRPTGEYRDAWPPPGLTVLYAAAPVHRTS
jgi:hypothetical protein